ncbi:di-trans,poly-cis-decaprenylcistransferase [Enterobacteriaceae endosymbiont of Donacia tomentosa]|uniref:polyprenyl diphosphate synthase n=1 Tax=Enterobacteriaceae endosymbiont of Donacia tomentosa TaxID=2675787 RepID=UPI00144985B4|nr:polyprenyl diphosphate synthase [Enterobacteriaceae endosymbiont of Donacia tomentosa]QJC31665.1 di-trans,poly-cis-decaprenylcistransferase [Enterobacteriaceae endosymbiont of Donacia tomentosa]
MIIENKNVKIKNISYPKHVAIIMDGNRRWAKKNGKLKFLGHQEGVKTVKKIVSFSIKKNIKILTLYAFSSENWNRERSEIKFLMKLFEEVLKKETVNLKKKNIRLKIIGNKKELNINLQNEINKTEHETKNNNGLLLNIAVNYGGRWDIITGVKKIAAKVYKGLLNPKEINENTLSKYICLSDNLPIDLVIRTGGEYRISNFLTWQIVYSELYFTKILWPDFNEKNFTKALTIFSNRERRFGGNCIKFKN